MNLGERIAEVRKMRGLTQEELGERCGASKQTIYKYEKGVITNIPLDTLEAIADALGASPGYFMGWDEKSPPSEDSGRVPPGYDKLNAANRAIVDSLIDQLAKSQQSNQ